MAHRLDDTTRAVSVAGAEGKATSFKRPSGHRQPEVIYPRDGSRLRNASGRTGVPDLVAQAGPVIDRDLWAVIRGGTRLPLPGNSANLNRLLARTEYTTVSAIWNSAIRLEADGHCRTAESALQLEERVRALITLARAAAKAPDLASALASVEFRRDGSVVRLKVLASPQAVQQLLGF